jgi:hypothetical protein
MTRNIALQADVLAAGALPELGGDDIRLDIPLTVNSAPFAERVIVQL